MNYYRLEGEQLEKSKLFSNSPEVKQWEKKERSKEWDKLAYKRTLQAKYPKNTKHEFNGPEHKLLQAKVAKKVNNNRQRANKLLLDSMTKSLIRKAIHEQIEKARNPETYIPRTKNRIKIMDENMASRRDNVIKLKSKPLTKKHILHMAKQKKIKDNVIKAIREKNS